MPLYLTPERYRTMGFGPDLSIYDDIELSSILWSASARANAYCAAPRLPQEHDFRGGTIVGEQHSWSLGSDLITGQRRFYAWHQPVIDVSRLRIKVTNSQYVDVDASGLFINNSEGYIEVVMLAVTTVGVFGSGLLPNVGLASPVGEADYTYGWSLASMGETLYESDGQTYRAQNQWWHTTPAPVIYKNGAVQSSGFTIDYDEGTVTFNTPLTATDSVKADYYHRMHHDIASAIGYIATHMIGESALARKGLVGVGSLRVAEVQISRAMPTAGRDSDAIPDEAVDLLEPFRFRSIEGGA